MINITAFAHRAAAAFGAVVLTATLLVSSFSTQGASAIAGVLV